MPSGAVPRLAVRFWNELRRRGVPQLAGAYALLAWLVVEAASTMLPVLESPEWVLRVLVVAALAGFPVAVLLAWFLDWTGDGVRRISGSQSASRRQEIAAIAGLVLLVLGGLGLAASRAESGGMAAKLTDGQRPRLAVLPFQSLADEELQYLADGFTENLIASLSAVEDLAVLSRTSAAALAADGLPHPEIGGLLNANQVIEGSVQVEGEQVRVVVQLIDARSDQQLWAATYERPRTDLLRVQADVAARVVDALHARLSRRERRQLESQVTSNPVAWELYLRARQLFFRSPEDNAAANELVRHAVRLDADFALGFAQLSSSLAYALQEFGLGEEWVDSAVAAAERALALDPRLPEAHLVRAITYVHQGRVRDAVAHLKRSLELRPGYGAAMAKLAFAEHVLGNEDQALLWNLRSLPLDPLNPNLAGNIGVSLSNLGLEGDAGPWFRRALEISPDWPGGLGHMVTHFSALGQHDSAAAYLRRLEQLDAGGYVTLYARAAAARGRGDGVGTAEALGELHRHYPGASERASLSVTVQLAAAELEVGNPAMFPLLLDEAEREAQEALATGTDDPTPLLDLAAVAALRRQRSVALAHLERAFDKGFRRRQEITTSGVFDSLSGDPRFEALLGRIERAMADMRRRAGLEGLGSRPLLPPEHGPAI